MGAERSGPRRRIGAPGRRQCAAQPVLDREGGRLIQPIADRAEERKAAPPGRAQTAPAANRALRRPDERPAPGRRGDRVPSHPVFQARKPARFGAALGQQPAAAAHGGVMRRHLARMGGVQRPDQPVEEPPPPAWALAEQPVHLRRDPGDRDMRGELRLARAGAIQPHHAALAGLGSAAGADEKRFREVVCPHPARRRPSSSLHRPAGAGTRRPSPVSGHAPGRGERSPPADSSCRCRWGRRSRRSVPSAASSGTRSCGSR